MIVDLGFLCIIIVVAIYLRRSSIATNGVCADKQSLRHEVLLPSDDGKTSQEQAVLQASQPPTPTLTSVAPDPDFPSPSPELGSSHPKRTPIITPEMLSRAQQALTVRGFHVHRIKSSRASLTVSDPDGVARWTVSKGKRGRVFLLNTRDLVKMAAQVAGEAGYE